jgi:hypothetical protein
MLTRVVTAQRRLAPSLPKQCQSRLGLRLCGLHLHFLFWLLDWLWAKCVGLWD